MRIAALLHPLAELLLWCFAPEEMIRIVTMQRNDHALRSKVAQHTVFGFAFADLQSRLAKEWGLPKLLVNLMDEDAAPSDRTRNVLLAVNLARHSANGWDDAALPNDYREIGAFLRLELDQVLSLVGAQPVAPDEGIDRT